MRFDSSTSVLNSIKIILKFFRKEMATRNFSQQNLKRIWRICQNPHRFFNFAQKELSFFFVVQIFQFNFLRKKLWNKAYGLYHPLHLFQQKFQFFIPQWKWFGFFSLKCLASSFVKPQNFPAFNLSKLKKNFVVMNEVVFF